MCRHGLPGGRARRSTARASARSNCACRCRRRSPAAELQSTSLRDGPAVRVDLRASSTATDSGMVSLLMPQRVLLKHRGDAVAANEADRTTRPTGGARFGEEVMRSSVHARSDDAAVAADARRDRRFPRGPDHRDRCDGAVGRAAVGAQEDAVRLRVRQARAELHGPRQASLRCRDRNSSMGFCPAERAGRIGDDT